MRMTHTHRPASLDRVNLQHPNWTGRAYRTAREAFGVGLDWKGYDNRPMIRDDMACIACGVVLVVVIAVCGFAGVF